MFLLVLSSYPSFRIARMYYVSHTSSVNVLSVLRKLNDRNAFENRNKLIHVWRERECDILA